MKTVQDLDAIAPGIAKILRAMYENEAPQDIHPSLDPQMGDYAAYIAKATAAG